MIKNLVQEQDCTRAATALRSRTSLDLFGSSVQDLTAQALRWLMFVATEIYPIVEINDYPERFSPDPESTSAVRDVARSIWRDRWLVVEREIAGAPYLLSSGFCVTDIYIAVVSRWAQQDEWRPEHLPKVEALTHAVAARPELASTWARHRR